MIDKSYFSTASKQKKQRCREPKDWLVPANPKYYDIVHAFDKQKIIDWKQGTGIIKNDIVYMYVTSPISAILYKCKVIEIDIPFDYKTKKLTISKLMKIKLLKRYKEDEFTFEKLKNEYGIFAIRGPRSVPNSLRYKLNNGDDK